jgi:hypothetical protein
MSRMYGAISPLSQYVFMARCSVKALNWDNKIQAVKKGGTQPTHVINKSICTKYRLRD